jgi:hypothetical protein
VRAPRRRRRRARAARPAAPVLAARYFASARAFAEASGAVAIAERLRDDEQRFRLAAPTGTCRVVRRNGIWEFAFDGRQCHVKEVRGLHHLAKLLSHPGREMHVLELLNPGGAPGASTEEALEAGLSVTPGQRDGGPVLDAKAKEEYRRRREELRAELEQAEAFHDMERAARAREELDFLNAELASAIGLNGRDRRPGGDTERARVSVRKAIDRAVKLIGESDEALAEHLAQCLDTGTYCVYNPGPSARAWEIR